MSQCLLWPSFRSLKLPFPWHPSSYIGHLCSSGECSATPEMGILGGKHQSWRPSWRLASKEMKGRNYKFALEKTTQGKTVSVERKTVKELSGIQRKSGKLLAWELTDYMNRGTSHPHGNPKFFSTACFHLPSLQWFLQVSREPPLFNVKVLWFSIAGKKGLVSLQLYRCEEMANKDVALDAVYFTKCVCPLLYQAVSKTLAVIV